MSTRVSVNRKTSRELWAAPEFLEWLVPGVHADLRDGEPLMHSPVSLRHARLLNFVDGLLRTYIERHNLGELFREVVAVRLGARNVFMPDLAFFTTEQVPRLGATYATEAPAMVVEALSEGSADWDVGPKLAKYEQAGVREYWVLDPETLAHRFYRKDGEIFLEFASGEPLIRSEVVKGFWVERAWLDPDHLPKVAEAFARFT